MYLYDKVLNNKEFLDTAKKIESIKFITDGKWDWGHGLGHYKRVSKYVEKILLQLGADERTIDLGMTAALLHDIGLSKTVTIPHKISKYLNKNFRFMINNVEVDISDFIN